MARKSGLYTASEQQHVGWTLINPATNSYVIDVISGQGYGPYTFTNFQWATITACKQDTDGNYLSGWTINLAGPDPDIGVTGTDGCYTFTVKHPGHYDLSEVQQAGWTLISPSTNNIGIDVTSGQSYDNNIFTNFQWATITVCKQDTDGKYLSGWTINLAGPDPNIGVTGSFGCYTFTVKHPGHYDLSEVQQAGWSLISPTTNNIGIEVTTGQTYVIITLSISSGLLLLPVSKTLMATISVVGLSP